RSTYNVANLFTGNIDVPLTALGEAEALAAGKKIKEFTYNVAYTSMLIRAQETLRIILKEIQQTTIPVIKNAALDERMYGNLQGLNKRETAAKYGDAQVEIWRRSYAIRPPGGESLEDTFNRTVPFYKLEIEPKLRSGENILIRAHGNSLRALMMYLENISREAIVTINIPTGLPRLYSFDDNQKLIGVKYL
ncbi:MAG: 2,3-bisphosphoglycerate-dependent phosphoglycerate mutase, partial [Ferruginibacter sp.]|nr:2,3-bisphosphoglycerate-dependent phosphoglycerate mutase [Ferruginibacter sp.]